MGKVYDDFEVVGVVRSLSPFTRNAASYANVTGAAITIPASQQDPTQADALGWLEINYNCTLEKATGGGGSVRIVVDGVAEVDSVRSATFAQAPAGSPLGVGGTFYVPLTKAASINVVLQAICSDTNVLTVSLANMSAKRVRTPGGLG